MRRRESTLSIAPFFVLRTPLLAFSEVDRWGAGEGPARAEDARLADLRAALRAMVERPEVREALYLASPSLEESIEHWLASPRSERGAKVERGLVRYLTRMASRATPFGLFAAVSTGQVGSGTQLRLGPRATDHKRVSLDAGWLADLCDVLLGAPALRRELAYEPNSSLFRSGGRLRYFEARGGLSGLHYQLVGVDDSAPLQEVLQRAAGGARLPELAATLTGAVAGLDREEAEAFLDELVAAQVLIPRLHPPVTGGDGAPAVAGALAATAAGAAAAEQLRAAQRRLDDLGRQGLGSAPAAYRALAGTLDGIGPPEARHVFKGDLYRPAPGLSLDRAVAEEIAGGCELLARIGQGAGPRLDGFRDAFRERYESRSVPLLEVLDPELGIGFPAGAARPPDALAPLLLRRLEAAWVAGDREIALDPDELAALERREPLPLPHSFAAGVVIAARSAADVDRGDYQYHLQGVGGTTAATLLGRFCQGDPALAAAVAAVIAQEEALEPEAVFAEIVHVPEGRAGNVIARPILRRYEIPFLGRSGAPPERQLPLHDLLVKVEGERVMLWSRRLDREVIATAASAHNFNDERCLAVYRFLGNLSAQRGRPPYFSWGPLEDAAFLPRVRAGRLVLSLAHWNVPLRAFGFGTRRPEQARALMAELRRRLRLPRFVTLDDEDHSLLIDLENPLCAEPLWAEARKEAERAPRSGSPAGHGAASGSGSGDGLERAFMAGGCTGLTEKFPAPDQLCVQGEDGGYVHELVLPLVRAAPKEAARPVPRRPSVAARAPLRHAPGADWLYAKLYTGPATLEAVLGDLVDPLVAEARREGAVDRWWYVRYHDPHCHLRLRLHGDPAWLWQRALAVLHGYGQGALAENTLHRLQIDTYEPEVERYGGPGGLDLCEQVFSRDSDACLALVRHTRGDAGAAQRWYVALRSVHHLLEDFGLPDEGKASFCRRLAGAGPGAGPRERRLSERFRSDRKRIEAATFTPGRPEIEAIFGERRGSWRPLLQALARSEGDGALAAPMEDVLASLVHMHLNRLLRQAEVRREGELYDQLARTYESLVARRGAGQAGVRG